MSSSAQQERNDLVDLLTTLGPDAPTRCEGWLTSDLAAHLVVRERRPDAAAGIILQALSGYTERVQRRIAQRPFADLLTTLLSGPPLLLRPFDETINTVEYFVHHEDLRREQTAWEPRPLDPALEDQLWSRLRKISRLAFRRSPVGVTLARLGGETIRAKAASPIVVVSGSPSELTLFAFGRQDRAVVELSGDPSAVQALKEARLGL